MNDQVWLCNLQLPISCIAGIYLFTVNNGNNRTMRKIYSNMTKKRKGWQQ